MLWAKERFVNLHTERLVTLLQTAQSEELECVHVLAVGEFGPLAHAQGERGHEGLALHVGERRLAAERVHQQLAVQREALQRGKRKLESGGAFRFECMNVRVQKICNDFLVVAHGLVKCELGGFLLQSAQTRKAN
jgi:hypothetical protein